MTKRIEPEARSSQLLEVAVNLAAADGLHSLTRERIAQAAGCSAGLVSARLGTMEALRRSVMRAAVRQRVVRIVAEGLVAGDKHAQRADADLKALAAAWVVR